MNRAELGALRDAIDTILAWPDSLRDQIAQWLQTDATKPHGGDPGRLSHSRSNRRHGSKPGAQEASAREQALLEAMRRPSRGWEGNPVRQKRSLHEGAVRQKSAFRPAVVASVHDQPVPIFQQLARSHPSGCDDVREISSVAAQHRRSLGRTRDRHQPRDRPALVEPVWPNVRRGDPQETCLLISAEI